MKAFLIALACLLFLTGCAIGSGFNRDPQQALPEAPELQAVPFFPQEKYQCGPAALATVLGASGVSVSPDALVPKVYLPGRRGSLQAELLGASRRYDRIPYPAGRSIEQLAAHLRDGRPVLVLQNLGFRRFPVWHYAVVVGFDAKTEHVVLRSGKHRRYQMSPRRFLSSWAGADHWAMVLLKPGEIPQHAGEAEYLQAVAGLEAAGQYPSARLSYQAALATWPGSDTALLGIAFNEYQLGFHELAEQSLRRLLRRNPSHAVAWNNLAEVLRQRGCPAEASKAIEIAISLSPTRHLAALQATRAEIETRPRHQQYDADCAPVPGFD